MMQLMPVPTCQSKPLRTCWLLLAGLMYSSLLYSKTYQFLYPSWIPVTIQHDAPFQWNVLIRNDSIYSSYNFLQNSINDMMAFWPQPPNITATGIDLNQTASASIANLLPTLTLNLGPHKLGSLTINGTYSGAFLPLGFFLSANQLSVSNVAFVAATASITITHPRLSMLLGLAAHPFCRFVHPQVVSLNAGVPIAPQAADPQVSIAHKIGKTLVEWTAYTEFLNQSNGPQGFSTRYIRRGMMPGLTLTIRREEEQYLIGAALDIKRLVPLIADFVPTGPATVQTFSEPNGIVSLIGTIFGRVNTARWNYRAQFVLGQNGTNLTNLGGYTIRSQDSRSFAYNYTNIWYLSGWADISARDATGFCWTPGIFAGYTQMLGTIGCINAVVPPFATTASVQFYGISPLQQLWRISPRVTLYRSDHLTVQSEIEYTNTTYGTLNTTGRFGDLQKSQLLRFIFTTQVTL
ncbi:hypothetical protein M1466_01500 [Candidatus Dependentiae bacterium]|nr:hypothetical protein [Candidatus Dependentiae bacterium]